MDEVTEKAPSLSALAEPKSVVPLKTFTVFPASALPVIVGFVSLVDVEIIVSDIGVLRADASAVVKLRVVVSPIPA